MPDAKVSVELLMKADEFQKVLQETTNRLRKVNKEFDSSSTGIAAATKNIDSGFKKLTAASALFYGVVGTTAYKALGAASSLQEQTSKFNVVFGEQQALAESWAETLQEAYAMSEREAKQNLAAMMDLLEPMGMNAEAAAKMSFEVVKLAADLGSFNNLNTEDVMADMQSALVGNYETMKKYGVVLNETVVKEEARRMGLVKRGETLNAVQKSEAAYSLIVKGSQNAIGDMARTSGSYANSMKRFEASLENIAASIGETFLPMIAELASGIADMVNYAAKAVQMGSKMNVGIMEGIPIFGNMYKSTKRLSEEIKNYRQANEDLAKSQEKVNQASKKGADKIKELSDAERSRLEKLQGEREKIEDDYEKRLLQMQDKKEELLDREYLTAVLNAKRVGADTAEIYAYYAAKTIEIEREKAKRIEEVQKQNSDLAYNVFSTQVDMISKLNEINKAFSEKRLSLEETIGLSIVAITTSTIGEIANLYSMYAQNRTMEIDNRLKRQLDAISEEYDAQKEYIENTITDEDERNEALKALDEKRAREEKAAQEKAEKDKRKIQRESAKIQKNIAIYETLISIPQSAQQAYKAMVGIPYVGPFVAAAAATVATALGFAKLALIRKQPLPELAAGGLFTGPAIVAEKGREFAFPLDGAEGLRAMDILAERLLNTLFNKINKFAGSASSGSSGGNAESTMTTTSEEKQLYKVAPTSIEVMYDEFFRASQEGRLFIAERAVV